MSADSEEFIISHAKSECLALREVGMEPTAAVFEKYIALMEAKLANSPPAASAWYEGGIVLNLPQVKELLEFFGGEPSDVTIKYLSGEQGDGIYVWCSEYPEEGTMMLTNKVDENDTRHAALTQPQQTAASAERTADIAESLARAVMTDQVSNDKAMGIRDEDIFTLWKVTMPSGESCYCGMHSLATAIARTTGSIQLVRIPRRDFKLLKPSDFTESALARRQSEGGES